MQLYVGTVNSTCGPPLFINSGGTDQQKKEIVLIIEDYNVLLYGLHDV